MYLYRFCPSRVHPWGRGRAGASLAASAAPAAKIPASSQTGLSYGLWRALLHTAACSQREPSPSLTGTGRLSGAGSCLALHVSASPSFSILLGRISCSLLGWLCIVQAGSTGNLRQQLLCMNLAALPGLPRVSTGPSFSLGASTTSWTGLSSLLLGQLTSLVSTMAKASHNTVLDVPLQVSLRRSVSQSGNPETIPLF